jgi:Tfp pilus assembly protein PilV
MIRNARYSQGFALLDGLAAFAIVALGLLAMASMQLMLSRSADVAKQRSEATRLAQDKMEELRSYTGISTGTINWNGLASNTTGEAISSYVIGTSSYDTNTTFTRLWQLGGTVNDSHRPASVTVNWTDRTGQAQSVVLNSVIARVDPADSGFLSFPLPQNTNLKRPKNRNINIPVQAIDLGGGKSAFQLAGNYAIVFNDLSGYVIEKCNTTVTAANYANGTAGCSVFNAFILAGYVSGSITNSGSGTSAAATMPTGINVTGLTGWDNSGGNSITCTYVPARDQNNTDADLNLIAGYQYYLCVIPMATGGTWSGTVRLGGVTTSGNYKVCRFQYAASAFVDANERNVQPYVNVGESLDNQNYYIENSNNNNCPTITTASGVTGGSVATVLHQNCRSSQSPTTDATGTCPATAHNAPSN